jgi:hypothetical protein
MSQTREAPDRRMTPSSAPTAPAKTSASMPRWVKACVFVAILLIVLFVILHLTGNGFGDHMHASAMSAIASGIQRR